MNKRLFVLLMVLMSLSLIGIIFVQTYYIDNSVKNLTENNNVQPPLEKETINLEVSFEEPKKINPHDELEEANIVLDVEELVKEPEDPTMLKEMDFTLENNLETITLKKPNQVYYEIYKNIIFIFISYLFKRMFTVYSHVRAWRNSCNNGKCCPGWFSVCCK